MAKNLTGLFSPQSVCVIGASHSQGKVGNIVLKNIINSGFKGAIFPVNPNVEAIGSMKVFPDVESLPQVPDLAVIAIPASAVLQELAKVGEKGIKNAVVFSAGFKETGEEGKKLEEELVNIAQRYNINVLGPNCLGFVNNLCPINVTFSEVFGQAGNLRFISQSGAIASSLFDWCKTNGIGFSQFITLGNKAVLNENDVLEYFQNNKPASFEGLPNTHPIGLYLESIVHGGEFLRLASEISKTDPIFIIKPGKTPAAAKAMQSHTGAIAGEDAVLEAVLSQAGVIRCQTLEDFFVLSRSFSWNDIPQGDKVAIISNAGGPAVISADAVITEGLSLAEFDESTHRQLLDILPREAGILNPVDVLGDALADRYAKASEIILQNVQVNALVVILTPQVMTQIGQTAENLGRLSHQYHKPIFCSFIGGSKVLEGGQILNKLKIASYRYPELAIWAIGKMWQFRKYQQKTLAVNQYQTPIINNLDRIQQIVQTTISNNQQAFNNLQANEIISLAGISTPSTISPTDLDEAKKFAKNYGYPVVLKLSSPNLLHKKTVGGVITSIGNDNQLEAAWNEMRHNIFKLDQNIQNTVNIQIQIEILNAVEVIIGVKKDPNFGPVLLFGAGGSFAELIADRNLHLLPVDLNSAKELVENSKIYSLLSKPQSTTANSMEKLFETIVRLGKLALNCPEISEIEINPALITTTDVWAVDCKVVI